MAEEGRGAPAEPENTLKRDRLALIRTVLANERTLLAYLRTSLALIITGVSALHFLDDPTVKFYGTGCAVLGVISLWIGFLRFKSTRRRIYEEDSRS